MPELRLKKKLQDSLGSFVRGLENIYKDGLVSVVLYGSASSGEFIEEHSNLNLLVVLKDNSLESLKKAAGLVNKFKFRRFKPLFFTEGYIKSSLDVFPIEFLDMKDNYVLLWGRDILKDLTVDTRNLRFQCEQELKEKLLGIKQIFLKVNKDNAALRNLLFRVFTSVLHILRMALRLKGKSAGYAKSENIKNVAQEFKIDQTAWEEILAAKNKEIKLNDKKFKQLFFGFVSDLERIVAAIDNF